MQLTYAKDGTTTIKTKTATITLGLQQRIGELELPGPGEYEASGVFAEVSPEYSHLLVEEVSLVYLHDGLHDIPTAALEPLENVDVLILSVDKPSAETTKAAHALITKIEPRVVVIAGLDDPKDLAKIEGQVPTTLDSLKLGKSDLPEEEQLVYHLASA